MKYVMILYKKKKKIKDFDKNLKSLKVYFKLSENIKFIELRVL